MITWQGQKKKVSVVRNGPSAGVFAEAHGCVLQGVSDTPPRSDGPRLTRNTVQADVLCQIWA